VTWSLKTTNAAGAAADAASTTMGDEGLLHDDSHHARNQV